MNNSNSLFECTNCKKDLGPKGQSHLTNTPEGEQDWTCQPFPATSDVIMENLAILDGLTRDGWSEAVIDRVERTLNAHSKMKLALELVKHGYQPYEGYIMTMVNQALDFANGEEK